MTIDGYTDLHVGWGRGAEDEREGSKRRGVGGAGGGKQKTAIQRE